MSRTELKDAAARLHSALSSGNGQALGWSLKDNGRHVKCDLRPGLRLVVMVAAPRTTIQLEPNAREYAALRNAQPEFDRATASAFEWLDPGDESKKPRIRRRMPEYVPADLLRDPKALRAVVDRVERLVDALRALEVIDRVPVQSDARVQQEQRVVEVAEVGHTPRIEVPSTGPLKGIPQLIPSNGTTATSLAAHLEPCPACGSQMKVRWPGGNHDPAKFFWGCAMFPRCRGNAPYDEKALLQRATASVSVTEPQSPQADLPAEQRPTTMEFFEPEAAVDQPAVEIAAVDRDSLGPNFPTHIWQRARPRIVLFGVPGIEELREWLRSELDGATWNVRECETGDLPHTIRSPELPTWFVSERGAALRALSGRALRTFAFPLASSSAPYVVAFAEPWSTFAPRSLSIHERSALDLEDIGSLLCRDAMRVATWEDRESIRARLPLTPIEEMLARALTDAGLDAEAQVRFGKYVADFVVDSPSGPVAVEADGAPYHDPARDEKRDAALKKLGVAQVVRFTGRDLYRDADGCVAQLRAILSERRPTSTRPLHLEMDPQQSRAVAYPETPLRVLAPAGAGKTRVLIQRVAELIERGVPAERILTLAFNKKANEQLVQRLAELQIPAVDGALFDQATAGVRCATFNAFGSRYQRERLGPRFALEKRDKAWREIMGEALDSAGISLHGVSQGTDPVRAFLDARKRAASDLVRASDIEVEIEYHTDDKPRLIKYGPVDEAFERIRLGRQVQSYDDQLPLAIKAMLDDPIERQFAATAFDHVLVDEFQDLNEAQLVLVDLLTRPERRVTVVGDDDQLIYSWRFARLANIRDFEDRMPQASTVVLETNYRCASEIVHASRRVIDHNSARVPKNIRPRGDAPDGRVLYVANRDWQVRSKAITDFLREMHGRSGEWRKSAVLCRYNAQQQLIAMALDQADIPRSPLLSYKLFSNRNLVLLRTYLELIVDPSQVEGPALAQALNRPNRFATKALKQSVSRAKEPWNHLLAQLDEIPQKDAFRVRALRELVDLVERWRALPRLGATGGDMLLDGLAEAVGLTGYWKDAAASPTDGSEVSPLELLALAKLHAADLRGPADVLTYWYQQAHLEESGEEQSDDTLAREEDDLADRVVISTIHAAKGKEYDAVVLPDYDPDLSRSGDHEIEEERRVSYVGMTRAREALLITIRDPDAVPRFVRESIKPPANGEQGKLVELISDNAKQGKAASVEVSRRTRALGEAENGALARELKSNIKSERADRDTLLQSIRGLEAELARAGIVSGITGKRTRLTVELAEARSNLNDVEAKLESLEQDLLLLEDDTDRYLEPLKTAQRDAIDRLRAVDDRREQLENRLMQIRDLW